LNSNSRRSERVEVVDWGCGYGRDSLYFLELGFDVIGIDVSRTAVALARAAYKQRQKSGVPLIGSASFHAGHLRSVFRSRVGQKVCAFFSNRVLHLLSETDFRDATREAIGYLEQGAYFCVSARSRDDFNSAVMEWVPGREEELAKYKDPARDGHEMAFVTKERLLRAVGHDLMDTNFLNVTEPERVGAPDTHLLVILGRTRASCLRQTPRSMSASKALNRQWPTSNHLRDEIAGLAKFGSEISLGASGVRARFAAAATQAQNAGDLCGR
jgi:SAM-dependent methyltransferase